MSKTQKRPKPQTLTKCRMASKALIPSQPDLGGTRQFVPSESFRAWFGESKVRDAEGLPLVVYHSATQEFSRFRRAKKDLGFHFGSAGQAEDRFSLKQHHDPFGIELNRVQPCTLPIFLAISNPLRLTDSGDWERDTVVANLPDEFTLTEVLQTRTSADVRDLIQSHGYDGIVYRNDMEAAGLHPLRLAKTQAFHVLATRYPDLGCMHSDTEKTSEEYLAYAAALSAYQDHIRLHATDSWIAFETGQAKSALSNTGAFKRTNPDITDRQTRSSRALEFLATLPTAHAAMRVSP